MTEQQPAHEEPVSAAELLAKTIRRLRSEAELSQPQLATLTGYSPAYVSLAERNKQIPSIDLVRAIGHALNAEEELLTLRHRAVAEKSSRRRSAQATEPSGNRTARTGTAEALASDAIPTRSAIQASQQEWLGVRQAPGVRGRELTELAAWLYPDGSHAPGGHVLAGAGWLLPEPAELSTIALIWQAEHPQAPTVGPLDQVLPLTDRGVRYASYSRAVRDLVRPRLLENRLCYRLLDVGTQGGMRMVFGTAGYFEVFDVKQAIAHEFKAAWLAADRSLPDWERLPLRRSLTDPFDPGQLLMCPGISTLTIRRDRAGDHTFVLHERDGAKVADGGGLCHVTPSGEFQPSTVAARDIHNDFSLWRNIMREYSEEFLGNPEHDGNGPRSLDYANQDPFRSFERARASGRFRLWHYGLIMEPLELGAGQLTVAVIDGDEFDTLFAGLVEINDEGRHVGTHGRLGMPFTREAIDRLNPRLSASALTLLELAWRDRVLLLHG